MTELARESYNFQKIIMILGAFLLILKFLAYIITDSVAILTDAVESIVNVVAGAIGLYALYLSARPPDKSHPFGHGRVELISATVEGSMITIAGVLIIFEAVDNIMNPRGISSLDVGLILIIIAAAMNFIVGTMAVKKGIKNRSAALEASGKHLRTDTVSSVGIIFGLMIVLLGDYLGYDWNILDPLIALFVGAMIIITGARVIKKALDGIMDKADVDILTSVVRCLNQNRSKDWIDIHNLRVIKYGCTLHIEMHVTLPFDMSVEMIEREHQKIHDAVINKFGKSVDLIMMPEPCKEFSCIHCERYCSARRAEFTERVYWSVSLLSQEHQHAYGNHVIIHDNGNNGEL